VPIMKKEKEENEGITYFYMSSLTFHLKGPFVPFTRANRRYFTLSSDRSRLGDGSEVFG